MMTMMPCAKIGVNAGQPTNQILKAYQFSQRGHLRAASKPNKGGLRRSEKGTHTTSSTATNNSNNKCKHDANSRFPRPLP